MLLARMAGVFSRRAFAEGIGLVQSQIERTRARAVLLDLTRVVLASDLRHLVAQDGLWLPTAVIGADALLPALVAQSQRLALEGDLMMPFRPEDATAARAWAARQARVCPRLLPNRVPRLLASWYARRAP